MNFAVQVPEVVAVPVAGTGTFFPVRRIYCVGRNYLEHIREMKEADERDPPFFFQKPRDALVLNGQLVPYPPQTNDFQFEVELVVAIGKSGRAISKEKALDHIFGYAVGFDITRRDRQRESGKNGLPWEIGKSFDRSAPIGAVHRLAQTGHFTKGDIWLKVNGQVKQKADLSQMIWSVAEQISKLSEAFELFPGDIIYAGTPENVGPVVRGDVIEMHIDGLPNLSVRIV
jgi:2-keto-4-pentenoate hydratase/2-oxohepta-3-ene-1,7-dioic acid hydratase in catechol pathway